MNNKKSEGENFVPKGAIAFFILMVLFYGFIWGVIWLIMILRG